MRIFETTSTDIKLDEIEKAGENFDQILSLDVDIDEQFQEYDKEEHGFVGKAFIYDEEIFVNTSTGEGYSLVFNKMKNYIDWYSGKIRLAGFEREDIKQLIALILLDGIRRYNPNLKIKLSTFLYVHIKNRIISRIKEETRQSLNATYNDPFYKFICKCGTSFMGTKANVINLTCTLCNTPIDNTWIVRSEHCEPVSLDSVMSINDENENSGDRSSRVQYSGQKNNFLDFFGRIDTADDIEKDLDLSNVLNNEDETTRRIAQLMYYNDYSITDAAREVGLTCWAASLRLKKLKHKKHVRDHFINK